MDWGLGITMRKRIGAALAGITFEDKPVDQYVKGEESTEIKKIFKLCTKRPPPKTNIKEKMPENTLKVWRRVKWWTNTEIRKEYGIMEKPFKTAVENILYLIINKGPISAAEIEALLGKKKNHLSAPLSKLYERLGDRAAKPILTRKKRPGGSYEYSAVKDVSVESGYMKYQNSGRRSKSQIPEDETDTSTSIKKAIENAIKDHLGVNVVISGKVEVVFKLG